MIKKIIMLSLVTSLIFAKTLVQEEEESLVKSIIPSTKVEKIERSEIDGLYKAYLKNGQILYVYPFKRLIFIGEIYTSHGQNITAFDRLKWQDELKKDKLKTLKKSELIKDAIKIVFNKGSKKYDFIIFTDPQCPFCRRVEKFFLKHNVTVYANFFPLPFHKNAKKWSLEILSSKDKLKAMRQIRETNKDLDVKITKEAKNRLKKMIALANKIGVRGTPFIIVAQKNKIVDIINGANLKKIQKYLEDK